MSVVSFLDLFGDYPTGLDIYTSPRKSSGHFAKFRPIQDSSSTTSDTDNASNISTRSRKSKLDDVSDASEQNAVVKKAVKKETCSNKQKPKVHVKPPKAAARSEPVKIGLYQCSVHECHKTFDDADKFIDHCTDKHKLRIYVCRIIGCVKTYTSANGLRSHCKSIHSKELTCEACKTLSLSPQLMEAHLRLHKESKYMCEGCKKSFTRANDHYRHWRYSCVFNEEKYMRCKHCLHKYDGNESKSEVAGGEDGLKKHLELSHGLMGAYLCLFCHCLFTGKGKLRGHNDRCTKSKPEAPLS